MRRKSSDRLRRRFPIEKNLLVEQRAGLVEMPPHFRRDENQPRLGPRLTQLRDEAAEDDVVAEHVGPDQDHAARRRVGKGTLPRSREQAL
jgi:hypothetical protein